MPTVEQVLVEFRGRNNVTPIQNQISNGFKTINNNTKSTQGQFTRLSGAGQAAFNSLKTGVGSFIQSMDGINGAISSVIAGFGAMEMASMVATGAMQAEMNQALLSRRFGEQAAGIQQSIQDIVAMVPGDDSFMNQLISGAAYRSGVANVEVLKQLGNATSDYLAASSMMGQMPVEAQRELKEYILTGNTGLMERDGILRNHTDKLKQATTLEERIAALNEAMNAEGYKGISQMTTAQNLWEQVKGKIQAAATAIGLQILPFVKQLLDFFLWLDTSTGGWSTKLIFIAGLVISIAGAFSLVAGPVGAATSMIGSLASIILSQFIPGMTAATATNMGFLGTLNVGWQSFVSWITGANAATIANWGFLGSLKAVFIALLTNPITWVVIAIVGLVVAVYEVGKAMGWWNDIMGFGQAIWNGLISVWNQVVSVFQPIIGLFQSGGSSLLSFTSIVNGLKWIWDGLVGSFFDSEGKFVGLIQGFQNLGGAIYNAITSIDWAGVGNAIITGLMNLPSQIMSFLGTIFGGLGTAITTWISSIDWMGVLTSIMTLIAQYNPITLLIYLLFGENAATAFSTALLNLFMTGINFIMMFINTVRTIFMQIITIIVTPFQIAFGFVLGVLSSLWAFVSGVFWGIVNTIGSAMGSAVTWVVDTWNKITSAFWGAVDAVKNAMQSIYDAIVGSFKKAVDVLKSFICPIIGCSPGIIPAFHDMGRVVPKEVNRIMPYLSKLEKKNITPPVGFGTGMAGWNETIRAGSFNPVINIPKTPPPPKTGNTIIHYHQETIDARNWTKDELMAMLYTIYK